MNECMLDRQTAGCVVEKIVLPQIVSIKQASEIMKLPPYYLRRVCRENPDIAFQSGVKWYINLGKLAAYYSSLLRFPMYKVCHLETAEHPMQWTGLKPPSPL